MLTKWNGLQLKHLAVGDRFVLVNDIKRISLSDGYDLPGESNFSLQVYARVEGSRNVSTEQFSPPAGHENENYGLVPAEWFKPGPQALQLLVAHKNGQEFISDVTPVIKLD